MRELNHKAAMSFWIYGHPAFRGGHRNFRTVCQTTCV